MATDMVLCLLVIDAARRRATMIFDRHRRRRLGRRLGQRDPAPMVRLARRDHVVERAEARRVDRERIAVHGPRWVDFLSAAFDPKRASVHDAPTTTTVLDLLADYGAVGAPRPMLSDIVATAARRLVDQLADWDDDPADLFADNIDLDEPLAFDARRPSSW